MAALSLPTLREFMPNANTANTLDAIDQLPSEEGSFRIAFPWTGSFDPAKSALGPESTCILVGAIDYEDFAPPPALGSVDVEEYPSRVYESFRPLSIELPDGRSLSIAEAFKEPGFDPVQIADARGEIFEAAKQAASHPSKNEKTLASLRASWNQAKAPTVKPRKP